MMGSKECCASATGVDEMNVERFYMIKYRGQACCEFVGYYTAKNARLDASCGFYQPDAICQQIVSSLLTSSSCIRLAAS